MDSVVELSLREQIMDWVAAKTADNGGWVTRAELLGYRTPDDSSLALIDHGGRGIRNPGALLGTLSITRSVDGPYADEDTDDGMLLYHYQSGGEEGSNRKLRTAFELGLPLILFLKPEKGILIPVHPVYVVADDRAARVFTIALDESFRYMTDPAHPSTDQRRYAVRLAKQRLHQPLFRSQVIRAYAIRCAVCSLRHADLLEAAHILPDSHPDGRAVTSNGLSLCSIHHKAYDRNLLGITSDSTVHINRKLLEETDGPMLQHGLKEMHGRVLEVPARRRDQPDGDALAWRFEEFLAVAG